MRGFVVLPKRWIVERFIARLLRTRRLARDSQRRTTSAGVLLECERGLVDGECKSNGGSDDHGSDVK